jgi:hypothetical protein
MIRSPPLPVTDTLIDGAIKINDRKARCMSLRWGEPRTAEHVPCITPI